MEDADPVPERKRRISITKLQRQTAAGAELIALCQTITEDGSLADDEVAALRQWLDDYRAVDLPARDFLIPTVDQIVADGKVTADERYGLYRVIETVLPPDIRSVVRDRRQAFERTEKANARAQREAEREAQREAKVRNLPIDSWDFMVASVRYEGRPEIISLHANPGNPAFLARDRNNAFSRNAVEVRLQNGTQIGFVPEEDAVEVAPLLDAGYPHAAYIKKVLTGGRTPIPVVVVSMYALDAVRSDLVFEHQVPPKAAPLCQAPLPPLAQGARTPKSGCAVAVMLLVAALGVIAWTLSMSR